MELNTQAGESKDEKVEVGKKLRAFRLTCYAMIVRERTVLLLSARLNSETGANSESIPEFIPLAA